jgi:hypothetical protein
LRRDEHRLRYGDSTAIEPLDDEISERTADPNGIMVPDLGDVPVAVGI